MAFRQDAAGREKLVERESRGGRDGMRRRGHGVSIINSGWWLVASGQWKTRQN
jgi:hypothetical protein